MARNGELFFRVINENGTAGSWVDAYSTYGIFFTQNSLSKLMTPAPNKAAIENKSRNQNGKDVIRKAKYAKKDDRDIDLEMHMVAASSSKFMSNYNNFCSQILDAGFFDIATSFTGAEWLYNSTTGQYEMRDPGKVFRMTYLSCSQFSEFCQELAKFSLRLNESDPSNREKTDSHQPKTT